MSRDDFYKPTDADALRMENELLAFEVRFLKTQLTETERAEQEISELKRELEGLRTSKKRELEEERRRFEKRLEEAKQRVKQGSQDVKTLVRW